MNESGWIWFGADGLLGASTGDAAKDEMYRGAMIINAKTQGPAFNAFRRAWERYMPQTDTPELFNQTLSNPDMKGWVRGVHDTELVCTSYTSLA